MASMSIIPDKSLFIITSAIKPNIGVFDYETRLKQTLETVMSIKRQVPDSLIIITDASIVPLTDDEIALFNQSINGFIAWSNDDQIRSFSMQGQKSIAESILMMKTLIMLRRNPQVSKMFYALKRIFKVSGRYRLTDKFDINEYNSVDYYGKYIFKTRMPSWCGRESLLITRLWSMCPSLVDEYIETLPNIIQTIATQGIDTEHAHFECINKEHLVEFEKVHLEGQVASTGEWHYD